MMDMFYELYTNSRGQPVIISFMTLGYWLWLLPLTSTSRLSHFLWLLVCCHTHHGHQHALYIHNQFVSYYPFSSFFSGTQPCHGEVTYVFQWPLELKTDTDNIHGRSTESNHTKCAQPLKRPWSVWHGVGLTCDPDLHTLAIPTQPVDLNEGCQTFVLR
ncbi:hypothetical protein E2C01_095570 [Portunus trituberculatus]|uniref:Uncharacterized protein n=1 Tax=Portunus trituberculatus TaxID=210409 RepID=A0A5B7K4J2_PORTR|nr:hypothetical protein [Portunus trituberculatus]